MADNWQEEVSQLLQQCSIGFLATSGEHSPETSMAPFAMYQGNILLHLSSLARHSKNILNQPNVGFMICTPETEEQSPLALPRLSIQGKIELVPDALLSASKTAYLERISDAEQLFSFADFKLFQIVPNDMQWVGGLGSVRKISVGNFQRMLRGDRTAHEQASQSKTSLSVELGMVFDTEFDRNVYELIKKSAKGHSKNCFRSAVRHLERAWEIKDIDPETAIFKVITAEEEAATAIFLILKERKYLNANLIKYRSHMYKQALEPFLLAFRKFMDKVSKYPDFIFGPSIRLSLDESSKALKIYIEHQGSHLHFIPPLGFEIKLNDKPYCFDKEINEIANAKNKSVIIDYLKETANERNILLYAQPKGIPRIEGSVGKALKSRQRRVIRFMYIYALIFPYEEKAIFVEQALQAFLKMMGEIEPTMREEGIDDK